MAFSADELEQRAERAVRRGELLLALELFESLLADNPEDERVRQRMESVRALLQPSELVNRRRAEPDAYLVHRPRMLFARLPDKRLLYSDL